MNRKQKRQNAMLKNDGTKRVEPKQPKMKLKKKTEVKTRDFLAWEETYFLTQEIQKNFGESHVRVYLHPEKRDKKSKEIEKEFFKKYPDGKEFERIEKKEKLREFINFWKIKILNF